jgi:TP901 family phage tail tape measure protein
MANVGLLALKALAVGVGVAVAASIMAFSKFDAAMTASLAIVDDVSEGTRTQLENVAREVAKTTTFSANEAASAYYELFSAGQTVAQAMESLPVVAAFAQAGLMDMKYATELLVTSQTALGLAFDDPTKNMKEQKRVADVLAAANNAAVGTIQDFAEALTNRAAAAMKTYGIELEEGVAVLAAWAEQGLKGKTAGEAFAIVTRDLQKAALKEADAWREVGASVFDSEGNLRNMADIIGDLEDAMRGLSDAEKKQLLMDLGFQERSQARLLQLIGTSDAIRQFEKDFLNASGTVAEVAEKQLDTAAAQIKLLWHEIVDIFIGAGKEADSSFVDLIKRARTWVADIAPTMIDAAARFADNVNEFFTQVHRMRGVVDLMRGGFDFGEDIEGLSGAFEDLAFWLGEVFHWWDELKQPVRDALGDWAKLVPFIFLGAGALKAVAAVLAILGGPATIIAGIIAGLIILFKYLWENNEEFRASIQGLVDDFRENVVPYLEEAWVRIQEAFDIFLVWFEADALPWLKDLWVQVQETFAAAWDFIVALYNRIVAILTYIWENWGEEIISFLIETWEFIKVYIEGAFQIIEGIFTFFAGLLNGDWEQMWDGIKEIANGAGKILAAQIRIWWNAIASFLGVAWELLKGYWSGLWSGIVAIAQGWWANFRAWMATAWELFKGFWTTAWENLKTIVGTALGGLPGMVKAPINETLGYIQALINNAINGVNGFIGLVNKIPGVNIGEIGNISIPRLALGGEALRQGLALVGERGPEIIRLAKGAQVIPLNASNQAGVDVGPAMHVENVNFYGTPQTMLEDYRRQTKLALRGL